jgi:hypothetical protein
LCAAFQDQALMPIFILLLSCMSEVKKNQWRRCLDVFNYVRSCSRKSPDLINVSAIQVAAPKRTSRTEVLTKVVLDDWLNLSTPT